MLPKVLGLGTPITLESIFKYLGEYFELPWGVCSTTMRSTFNYLGEYVQGPWGVFSTTLGSMFNYPGEYVHYTGEYVTLGSMFNHPGEYFQLPWGALEGDGCKASFVDE